MADRDNIEKRISKTGKVSYRVRIELKGYKRQSATFSSKTKAKLWKQQTESAMREGRYFKTIEARKHTFGDLVDRYIRDVLPSKPKSFDKQKIQLEWWKTHLGHLLLSDLTPALIAENRDLLASQTTYRKSKRSPATVVRYLAALSHALSTAVKEWGWLEDSPMRKVSKPKEPRGRVRFLTTEERQTLLDACRQNQCSHLYPVVVLALSTGMRQMEILTLKWKDIDLENGTIILHETKNNERRCVPLTGHAYDLIKRLDTNRKNLSPFLFPSRRLSSNKPYNIRSAWEQAVKMAGIKDFRFHDLRHDFASQLLASGASLAQLSEVMGHKTLQMIKRYAHLCHSQAADILNKMNKRTFIQCV